MIIRNLFLAATALSLAGAAWAQSAPTITPPPVVPAAPADDEGGLTGTVSDEAAWQEYQRQRAAQEYGGDAASTWQGCPEILG